MPKTQFKIENGILKKCYSFEQELTVPDGVVSISSYAFAHCVNLTKITIPDGVKRICIGAFRHCIHLQSITIPEGVEHIGNQAFEQCYSLKDIVIPKTVTFIGKKVFPKKMQLSSCSLAVGSEDPEQSRIVLSALGASYLWLPYLKGTVQTNPIAEQLLIRKITSKAFRTKKIPILIRAGETEAFIKLFSLFRTVRLSPEELDHYLTLSLGNVEITNFLIGYRNKRYPMEKVMKMQNEELEKALGLREKTLSDYRKDFTIVKKDGCYIITNYKGNGPDVVIPGNIQGIPVKPAPHAFASRLKIERLYIEDGVTHLDDDVFLDCLFLCSVEIPCSVTRIETRCFEGCVQLTKIVFNGTKEQWYAISSILHSCTCEIFCTDGKILFCL